MNIIIESRDGITARAKGPFPAHTALISITDTDRDFARLENKPEHILRMKFDDVSEDLFEAASEMIAEKVLGREPTEAERTQLAKDFHMFKDEQAKEVAAFINQIYRNAETLICQCEYGQSRSAGIAAAVEQFLHGNGVEILAQNSLYYHYNMSQEKTSVLLKILLGLCTN